MTYMPLMYIKTFYDFTNSFNEIIKNLNVNLYNKKKMRHYKKLLNQIFVLIMMMLKQPNQK
ncbi:MAG: hypothetical protein Ct9H90mP3_6810 [Flammeovirgaceae bacterium]|nr:MAG: hypothetical protein Ct9H90mP3_6810 [Flammeovirgaceae bacterium]